MWVPVGDEYDVSADTKFINYRELFSSGSDMEVDGFVASSSQTKL
jgi:hypothetical protein